MGMLKESIEAVEEFHVTKNIDYRQDLTKLARTDRHSLIVHQMKQTSTSALRQFKSFLKSPEQILDTRLLRIHLILEEVAELIWAIDQCDEVETLDGMADAVYVINGTAITYDLPLDAAFDAVHASNMTKAPRAKNPEDARLQDKGSAYMPPNLGAVLKAYRTRKRGRR